MSGSSTRIPKEISVLSLVVFPKDCTTYKMKRNLGRFRMIPTLNGIMNEYESVDPR